ncbi:MAG: serine/threonine-protein phosphatase [Lachnospiraceae bacterium]|nr:serine/threonine-protein phosphatase [Lachnospiraceae bacterium]
MQLLKQTKHGQCIQQPMQRLLSYQIANLQGIGTRQRQEDSFAFVNAMDVMDIKNYGLLALMADGMGGMQDGKLVSETAIGVLTEDFHIMDRRQNMGIQLKNSIYHANDVVYQKFGGSGGTTIVACIFFQERLYFASVGDSFLYLKRGSGIYRLNREQTCRQEAYLDLLKHGILDTTEPDTGGDGSRLSQFLGRDELEEVDALCRPWRVREGDVLLLCSDGVGGVLTEQTLLACLSEPSPEQACRRMEQEIQTQGRVHQDNYTALVVACRY